MHTFTPDIEGKVVIITGAGTGIGEATARLLSSRGAKLVLAGRRAEPLAALAKALDCVAQPADVRRREDLHALVALAQARFGRLDVLINNAGIGPISKLDALRVDDWEAMIDTNFKGVLNGIAAALPVFRAQGRGHFVNVISTAGLQIVPTMAVYAATKNAVRTLTEGLRQEAGANLRVTGISPGITRTPFADSMTDEATRAELRSRISNIGISPEAIARAIAFAIEQPADVDVGDITIRPTAQG